MQELLGHAGIQHHVRYRGMHVSNFAVILNGIPALKENDGWHELIAETLARGRGPLNDRIREKGREATNPILWFREGVAAILLLPLQLLHLFGVLSGNQTASVAGSPVFRVLNGLLALIGLLGSIVTLNARMERSAGLGARGLRFLTAAPLLPHRGRHGAFPALRALQRKGPSLRAIP